MANGLALSTARGKEIFVGSEIRDSFSLLDILYANQFKGESLDPEDVEHIEETFYRGAPPEWLNFHISEQAKSDGTGTSFIKRDGYDRLKQQIQNKRKLHGISTVKLLHQPGCGGTTLAMQVLWDLRKTFRCAVLTGSTSDITNVATEVVHLFTAGSRRNQNTVLLLLNDEHNLENLQNSIMEKITEQKIVTTMPVVIFLTCVRKDAVLRSDHVVLEKVLSDTEKQKFNEKKKELSKKYKEKCGQFHGFNIMQTNFSQAYVDQACTVFSTVQRSNKPLKTQLATFLSLLNAYVPGSYLLESQCLDFLKHEDSIHGHLSLEDRMKPFSHLIITFQHDARPGKKVRMAHPMIAQRCTELMSDAGVTRSDTARNFMNCLCTDEVSPHLLGFVKDMLTKREMKVEENPVKGNEVKEDQERFSRLILDIQRKECKVYSASVLKMASKIFIQNPFFPQALARFYYIELKDYNHAERWAKEAKERDSKNSFVADTLGQVYKNHLKNKEFSTKPREILKLAKKAIQVFKDEERLAENEYGEDMAEDGNTKVSHIFNTRGQFGYLQVCNLLYDRLVAQNETWKRVLTNNVSMGSVLESLGDNKLYRFNHLISSLRDEVEKKCNFLNAYLTFSKPGMQKDDPSYIQRDVSSCYCNYTEHPLPDLISNIMDKFENNVEENMSPSDEDTPESHIVTLLKEMTENNRNKSSDLVLFTQKMYHSYECAYAKYFRSRYLRPLFYLSKDEALSRIAPTSVGEFLLENEDATTEFINYMTNNDKIFKDLRVQKNLLTFQGVVRNYKLFANLGGMMIMVNANKRDSLWIQRHVSFYLGFSIRGLVAFGIRTKNTKQGPPKSCASCGGVMDSSWTATTPDWRTEHGILTYRLQSEAGQFKCRVSGLRWVCKKKVIFTYQFKSWEEHRQKLNLVHCTPGGPLMNITVIDGELDEVHLPHWICIDGFPQVSDTFAVLHKGQSGNFIEEVSEVTSSHVRLFQPSFPTNGVLITDGFPVKAHCNILIYRTNQKHLTLHIYVILWDPQRQQEVELMEKARKSKMIKKPNLEKSLDTEASFILTTDADAAEISLGNGPPKFFRVFIKNANSDFKLTLADEENDIMWTCEMSKDDYQKMKQ